MDQDFLDDLLPSSQESEELLQADNVSDFVDPKYFELLVFQLEVTVGIFDSVKLAENNFSPALKDTHEHGVLCLRFENAKQQLLAKLTEE